MSSGKWKDPKYINYLHKSMKLHRKHIYYVTKRIADKENNIVI